MLNKFFNSFFFQQKKSSLLFLSFIGAKFFDSQTYEFLLFACLMFVDMGLFMWLGIRYKPIPLEELDKVIEAEGGSQKDDALEFPGKDQKND